MKEISALASLLGAALAGWIWLASDELEEHARRIGFLEARACGEVRR